MKFSLSPELPRWTWHLRHVAASIADGRFICHVYFLLYRYYIHTLLFSLEMTRIQCCSVYLTALLFYQVEQKGACKRRYMQLMCVWFMFIRTYLSSKLTWLAAGTMQSRCMTSSFFPMECLNLFLIFGRKGLDSPFFSTGIHQRPQFVPCKRDSCLAT